MADIPVIELIKHSELFREISDSYSEKISDRGRLRSYRQNELIFLEGDRGKCFYILKDGSVKLFKSGPDGRETIIKLLKQGEVFGEVIIFESAEYPVSAITVNNTSLFEISRDAFHDLLDDSEFRNEFIGFLMRKQRYLAHRVQYLSAMDVEERFFRFLKDTYGRKNSYQIMMSKKEIASVIGTIPETMSRLIQRLTRRGSISWKGNVLEISESYWQNEFENNY